jgi:hypothetical protein
VGRKASLPRPSGATLPMIEVILQCPKRAIPAGVDPTRQPGASLR